MRLLARECPECGARPKPQEVQHDLQRRERLVTEFHSRRVEPDRDCVPDLENLAKEHGEASKQVLHALSDAANSSRTADALLAAFSTLDQLVATWQNPLPRPQRNRGKIIGDALTMFSHGASLFVEALRAPDMRAAQDLERKGNEIFDESAYALADLDRLDEADNAFAESSASRNLNKIGQNARQLAGHESSISELDRVLRSGVGWESASEGSGLQSHAIHLLALSSFDLDAFTQVLTASENAVGGGARSFAQTEEWKRRHARAAALLGSAAASVHQGVFASDSSDFEVAHRAVEAVSTFRDGVLKHALASILATSNDEYMSLIRKNGGAVINKAASTHPELLLNSNLTAALRNAGAHADIDVNEHGLKIDGNSFSIDEFIDRFLAYLEATVATFVGVTLGVGRLGVELDYNDYLAPRDRDAAVALLVGAFGLECETVSVNNEEVVVQARGPEPDWMTLAAALSAMYPNGVASCVLHVTSPSQNQVFRTSLSRFRTYTDGIELLGPKEVILRLTAITAASSLDGSSPWPMDEWDKITNAIIDRQDGDDLRTWVRNVREFRGYAREAQIPHVASNCDRALAELRR